MDEKQIEILLKNVNLISKEFKTVHKRNKFNIFTIIRNGDEEVSLHSKFIFELLSSNGSHGKKDLFLKLLLKLLNIDFVAENAQVFCESDNIDLLIKNRSQAIIIENKIYAGDQPEQLFRYYTKIKESGIEDIHILYLSLDGKTATDQSIGKIPKEIIDKRIINKSYQKFIISWLDLCLKECATEPQIRETIVQYKYLLNQLTMNDDVKERIKLLELLGEGNNMEQTAYLVKNWNHMKWHTEMDFWNEMLNSMPSTIKKYKLIEDFLYDKDYIHNAVNKKRNRDFEYGIAFKLFNYKDEEICFLVERSGWNLDYGLFVNFIDAENENWKIKKTDFTPFLKKNISKDFIGEPDSYWIHWKESKQNINFENFDNSETLALANPIKRKVIVKNLWEEIERYINKVLEWEGKTK